MTLADVAERELALERVGYYRRQEALAEDRLVENVDLARRVGCSWKEIAAAMDSTHQNVISRFARRVTRVDLRAANHPRRAAIRAAKGWE